MEKFFARPEHVEYIRSIAEGRFLEEIHTMFNERFGVDLTLNQVKHIKKSNRIVSHVHGSNSEGGRFAKGHTSSNRKPIGTVSIRRHTGRGKAYYWIKTGENQWEIMHKYLWEKENGKVPEDHVLYFVDGNTLHYDIDNLVLIHRSVLVILNHWKMTKDADLNRCLIAEAELSQKLYELGVKGINSWNVGGRKKKC